MLTFASTILVFYNIIVEFRILLRGIFETQAEQKFSVKLWVHKG